MQLKTIAALVLAVALVTGSAAALPGNAPAQADDYANDSDAADANAERDVADDANDTDADRGPPADVPAADGDRRGPPADTPGQAPAFVGEIHSLIGQHVDGTLEGSLGERISDVTPDDENESDDADENERGEESETDDADEQTETDDADGDEPETETEDSDDDEQTETDV